MSSHSSKTGVNQNEQREQKQAHLHGEEVDPVRRRELRLRAPRDHTHPDLLQHGRRQCRPALGQVPGVLGLHPVHSHHHLGLRRPGVRCLLGP